MSKNCLVSKLFNKLKKDKNSQKNKQTETTKQAKEKFVDDASCLQKNRDNALEFQDEINNELWLNGQGG